MTSFNNNSTAPYKNGRPNRNNLLENIRVSWKLTLIIVVLVLGILGVFLSAFVGFQELNQQLTNMYDLTLLPVASLDRADIALGNIQIQLETLQNKTLSRSEIVEILNTIDTTESLFTEVLQRYEPSSLNADFSKTLTEQDRFDLQDNEKIALSNINLYYGSYSTQLDKLRTTFAEGGPLDSHLLETTKAAIGATRNYLRQLTDINRQFANVSNKAATTAYQNAFYGMAVTLLITTIIGLILAFVVARSITRRLRLVTQAAQSLQEGQHDLHTIINIGGKDEIAQLASAFDSMAQQLTQSLTGLEQRVAERTADLEQRSRELSDRTIELELANTRTQKRATQLQAISDIARAVASVHDLNTLLPLVSTVISEQFGFYHIGIFLTDSQNEYAILSAANSEGGERMLRRGHKLKVGAQGIVGYVTETGIPRLALDTGTDATFFNNPDLPDTRSEMAIPLKSGKKIFGALDVQSKEADAFTDEDLGVMQTLADQVSIAIENAKTFGEAQKSLAEVETISRQYLRREWDRISRSNELIGYRYTISGATPLNALVRSAVIQQATSSGEVTTNVGEEAAMAVPIKLRNEVIGILNIRTPGKRTWDQDEINLVQTIAERIAISAENARLFEDTSKRAERERMVAEISNKIRSTNDPEMMLRTAMEELKHALGATSVQITPFKPPEPMTAKPLEPVTIETEILHNNNGAK